MITVTIYPPIMPSSADLQNTLREIFDSKKMQYPVLFATYLCHELSKKCDQMDARDVPKNMRMITGATAFNEFLNEHKLPCDEESDMAMTLTRFWMDQSMKAN